MKRILLAMGIAATAFLIGCGGGGGSSTPSAPGNPGNPGSTATPAPGNSGTPGPTPTPSQSQNPSSTVVTIGAPGAVAKTAVNTLASGSTQILSTVGRISATQNGAAMSNGAAINATISSTDKSGTTCLVYVANGATTGSPCTYPAVGSTPAPVTIAHVNDGVAVQYNNGASAPGGTYNITGNVPGANTQPTAVKMNDPAPGIGHTASGSTNPWGGGIVYTTGNIYFTRNSAAAPIGVVSYANGAAGSNVTDLSVVGLTAAPAGGLILGPDGNLWGTEQAGLGGSTKVFTVSPGGGAATEVAVSCTGASQGGSGSTLLGPETGITADGTSVYVLCADVANHNRADNSVNTINASSHAVSTCNLTSNGGSPTGSFANGAVYANGTIYSETTLGGGGGAGGASSGTWISIPVSNCGNFTESKLNGSLTRGDGNVVLMSDGNLYSELDNYMASPSFAGATAANPAFGFQLGGGGLVQDNVLGSKWFFGTSDQSDLEMNSSWIGGTQTLIDANHNTNYLPISAGGTAMSAGTCEVAFNQGGGFGIIQLPDGKLAWPVATDGLESGRNYICIANL